MDEYFAEIRFFGGNFAPSNWALCQGQLLPINSNTALFSLIGNFYGGDGRTTFALPDLQGRVVVGQGQGAGLSPYSIGQRGGTETVTLKTNNLPLHSHTITGSVSMTCTSAAGNTDTPYNTYPASSTNAYNTANDGPFLNMQHNIGTGATGSSIPVNNIQPVLALTAIICISGTFPARS
jgi:microcystin-dependent protein